MLDEEYIGRNRRFHTLHDFADLSPVANTGDTLYVSACPSNSGKHYVAPSTNTLGICIICEK